MSFEPPKGDFPVSYGPPTPPKRRHRVRNTVIGVVGGLGLLAFVAVLAAVGSSTTNDKPSMLPSTSSSAQPASATSISVYTPPVSQYLTPTPGDFSIALKVLTKQCFGEAGCDLTYKPQLTETSLGNLDPSITYDVTYEVRGAQDGPIVDTIQVTGDQYSASEGDAQTASTGTKLRAVITSVEPE